MHVNSIVFSPMEDHCRTYDPDLTLVTPNQMPVSQIPFSYSNITNLCISFSLVAAFKRSRSCQLDVAGSPPGQCAAGLFW